MKLFKKIRNERSHCFALYFSNLSPSPNSFEMLEKTTTLTTDLANEAPKIKASMTAQVTENLGLAKKILIETADDIKKASRKHDKSVITELKADLTTAESVSVRAAADFEAGDILKASENLGEFQALIKKITDTLKPKPAT